MIEVINVLKDDMDDALALLRLFIENVGDPPLDQAGEARLREAVRQDRFHLFLALHDSIPVGIGSLSFAFSSYRAAPIAVFEDFFVLEEFRKKGVGSRLIETAMNAAKTGSPDHSRRSGIYAITVLGSSH